MRTEHAIAREAYQRDALAGRLFFGIDPGITGAVAAIQDGEVVEVWDMPTMPAGTTKAASKKQLVNPLQLRELMRQAMGRYLSETATAEAWIENVTPMPSTPGPNGQRRGMGATSAFNFGRSFAASYMVPQLLGLPTHFVTPTSWKRQADIAAGADKDAARGLAIRLFPSIADALGRKKDIGRADAILIARHGYELRRLEVEPAF